MRHDIAIQHPRDPRATGDATVRMLVFGFAFLSNYEIYVKLNYSTRKPPLEVLEEQPGRMTA